MVIIMKAGTSREEIARVEARVAEIGLTPHPIYGVERTIIGCIGPERNREDLKALALFPGVESVVPILKPYKLVSKDFKKEASVLDIAGEKVGGKEIAIMAGPCSVEGRAPLLEIAEIISKTNARFLRGGAFKPRTSPYAFQGLAKEGLEILAEAREKYGLKIVTEVVSDREVELVAEYADVIQIGARNCQNFRLLTAVGETRKAVLYKRGLATTIKEFLQGAEYLLANGNYNVMLCERGIRTFETATRNTLDLNAVPVMKRETHLPVIVDPSHGTGVRELVAPMAMAAIAAGADGLMIEMHQNPPMAFSDGEQSLYPSDFDVLLERLRPVVEAVGRTLTPPVSQ
jgi:3-deoxy-7-phosphoheptulonate synthase